MSAQINQGMRPCCAPVTKGYRLLTFPDGSQAGVIGLDIIFDDAYREGKRPEPSVANELVNRLSEKNYIPSSQRSQYEAVVLEEYQKFFEAKEKKKGINTPTVK
jgi:hypothetical protein